MYLLLQLADTEIIAMKGLVAARTGFDQVGQTDPVLQEIAEFLGPEQPRCQADII